MTMLPQNTQVCICRYAHTQTNGVHAHLKSRYNVWQALILGTIHGTTRSARSMAMPSDLRPSRLPGRCTDWKHGSLRQEGPGGLEPGGKADKGQQPREEGAGG